MGLNHAFARLAVRHAHALVVEVPGSWYTRMAAERAVLARGWRLAVSPADADVLVVCGRPGPRLAEAIELVWHQMPGPRVRLDLETFEDVGDRLDEARNDLLDTDHHRHDAVHRPDAASLLAEQSDEEDHGGHEGMDHGGHGGMDGGGGHEGMDHGGHGDMDMAPGGIPLARGGEDRDGLEMDVLHLRLGPVLPHWPAGLVFRCGLQGDVITEAWAELLDGDHARPETSAHPSRTLDNLASLLALAGWDEAAAEARNLRDVTLQAENDWPAGRVERFRRKLARSRTLRWSLRGVRSLSEEEVTQLGLPSDTVGDTYDRLVGILQRVTAGDAPASTSMPTPRAPAAGRGLVVGSLGQLVTGLDLATARLVVASLDLHHLQAEHAERELSHD